MLLTFQHITRQFRLKHGGFYLCFICLLPCPILKAQSVYSLVKKVPLKNAALATIDQKKNIYIADRDGNINQYDSTGNVLITYSPQKIGTVTSMVASQTIQLFIFYQDFQEYVILNRFLNQTTRQKFSLADIGFVRLATLASDNNIWLFDEEDMSIKKYDPRLNKVITKTSFDLLFDTQSQEISHLREYENLLYVADQKSGIWIFDNLGNFKKKLPYTNIQGFTVVNHYLYVLQGQKLTKVNIYSATNDQEDIMIDHALLKDKKQLFYPFLTGLRLYLVTPAYLLIYSKGE